MNYLNPYKYTYVHEKVHVDDSYECTYRCMYIYKNRINVFVNVCMYIYTKRKHTIISNYIYTTLIDSCKSRMLLVKCRHARTLYTLQHTATLQHCITAHCNTLQHVATHCNMLHAKCRHARTLHILQHTATHCNKLKHTATHCNTTEKYIYKNP